MTTYRERREQQRRQANIFAWTFAAIVLVLTVALGATSSRGESQRQDVAPVPAQQEQVTPAPAPVVPVCRQLRELLQVAEEVATRSGAAFETWPLDAAEHKAAVEIFTHYLLAIMRLPVPFVEHLFKDVVSSQAVKFSDGTGMIVLVERGGCVLTGDDGNLFSISFRSEEEWRQFQAMAAAQGRGA